MSDEIKKRFTAFRLPIGIINKGQIEFEQEKFSRLIIKDKEVARVNLIGTVIDKFVNDENSYASITLDDGTGNIRVKAFSDNIPMLKEIQPGDTVIVIGLLRYYNNEIYIVPDIIKQIDARWLLARKLELAKEHSEIYKNQEALADEAIANADVSSQPMQPMKQITPLELVTKKTEEKIQTDVTETIKNDTETIKIENENSEEFEEASLRNEIIEIIRAHEAEEGIDVDKLIMMLKAPVDDINSTIIELLEEGTIFEPRPGRLRMLK